MIKSYLRFFGCLFTCIYSGFVGHFNRCFKGVVLLMSALIITFSAHATKNIHVGPKLVNSELVNIVHIDDIHIKQENIPNALSPWIPWVMESNEEYACPFINRSDFSNQKNHLCAWSSTLTLAVKNNSASFKQSWQVLAKSFVPLPGNSQHWPLSVKVNNSSLPVVLHQGKPAIELAIGSYNITGQFEWPKIPSSISIPRQYAFVQMSINGKKISFPKIEQNELWLQALEPSQEKQSSIDVSVARRVTDGSYISLDTYIALNVSGKIREVILGKVLPKGVELIGIESKLSSFLDADGLLHVKLKPGTWQIMVRGYAKQTLLTWQRPSVSHYWPKDEIWVFEGDESLRLGKLSGGQIIDSNQAQMPKSWYKLPSYLLSPSDALTYDVQHRGKPLHIENQLSLNRTLWLSFDSKTYTFNDHISGSMINDWRLSMPAPYLLESAEDQDGSVLITTTSADERGIENRYPNVNVKARGVFDADSNIAITGWQSDFERVSLTLNLPPGNKLLAVFGADSVSNSWWSNWTIWASFIVLLSAFATSRLMNISLGVLTGLMLVLIYQESGVPIVAIINFLIAIGIKKYQPFSSLKTLVNGYWALSVALIVGSILLFSATQLRTVIHPQLEKQTSTVRNFTSANMEISTVSESRMEKSRSRMSSSMDEAERMVVTGSRLKKADKLMERYQTDALIQAGSGIPNWQWNQYSILWNSPVADQQTFNVVVLSKNSYRVIKVLGILMTLLWLGLILKDLIKVRLSDFRGQALSSMLVLLVLFPGVSSNTEAASFPEQQLLEQLKQRILAAPNCAPNCALINKLTVNSQEHRLKMTMTVHANADTAIALPRSEFWRPEKLWLNTIPMTSMLKRNDWIYIPVSKGISTIKLLGQIAPVDNFQLEFNDKPQHLELTTSNYWQVAGKQGNRLNGNTLAFLTKNNDHKKSFNDNDGETKAASSRYSYQPFVKVTRELSIDKIWTVETTITRIAPSAGSININIPTLKGEHIITADMLIENDEVAVILPAGRNKFSWRSTIDKQELLSLHANAEKPLIEQWQILVSPSWHADISGLVMILSGQASDDYFYSLFYPYPGETLTIATIRPSAVKGEVLAIDSVNYNIEQGSRTSKLNLSFNYRSTRGGEHIINLPEDYQLKEIMIDNQVINLQVENGELALPILPGTHSVKVTMRANAAAEMVLTAPKINLNAPISNITSEIDVSQQRWVLWANGPVLGPAVLYWGELLAFIIIALLFAKAAFSPLTRVNWLILGFGLSLNNWSVLMLVVVWFASLTASSYRSKNMSRVKFNFSQVLLYGLSIITLFTLISVIPTSLLSSPDMGITGNYSYGNHLQWFADKSTGALPEIFVISIPMLFYKGLMLAWVIWLSFNSLSWIKWAWKKLGEQGYWRAMEKAKVDAKENTKADTKANTNTKTVHNQE